MDIVFATNNRHKVDEAQAILGADFSLTTPKDLKLFEEIPETANTLQGNAFMKAQFIWERFHIACFADDTGLEVEALNGAPGVYSARYAGEEHDPKANTEKLLKALAGKKNRTARFRTVVALIIDGDTFYFEGILNGKISEVPSGNGGFGYDPVFIPEGYDKTLAELTPEEKNSISHRGHSLRQLSKFLNNHVS
ncbi:MAG: RdgB/HAM1 family non-canonical purine NTP pyrophosphatase [Rikenellaceae bacterium]|nr:RdgB/HAM1 family non-canonical purine NTP pyrophosphatase [Rikenellaceae bacterium]